MADKSSADYWIKTLDLLPHPEGGYFREVYRSLEQVQKSSLPPRFQGPRCFATSIYYLLKSDNFSRFHRIASDEIWHFYAGTPIEVHTLSRQRGYCKFTLGSSPDEAQYFQIVVPAGDWFGACLAEGSAWALVGCTVAPGFDFDDLEMAARSQLLTEYPNAKQIIHRLTHPEEDQ